MTASIGIMCESHDEIVCRYSSVRIYDFGEQERFKLYCFMPNEGRMTLYAKFNNAVAAFDAR